MTMTIYGEVDGKIFFGGIGEEAYEAITNVSITDTEIDYNWQSWNNAATAAVPAKNFYKAIRQVASYVNNELGDEFLLEVG